jgi:hypothetical protein
MALVSEIFEREPSPKSCSSSFGYAMSLIAMTKTERTLLSMAFSRVCVLHQKGHFLALSIFWAKTERFANLFDRPIQYVLP